MGAADLACSFCYASLMPTKRDFSQVMHDVALQATGAAPKPKLTAKQAAGRKGGLVGGKMRMESMTDEERAKMSALGVAARKTPASSGAGVKVTKSSG